MPICPGCGQENPAIAKFCLACGTAFMAPDPGPEEERKVVTALFTDIVGSTASAERMDPEDVRARLAPYYARVRAELESFGGTVEKFIGDAVVALFGAPAAHEDDPERAVRAALAIKRAVADLNAADTWLDIHLRTAVHTGEALVVLGARSVEGEGMASGDVMNTAARLQSGAPVDGIVVGEATYRATANVFEYREGTPVQAKGKTEPVPIWEVVTEKVKAERPAARGALVGRSAELATLAGLWDTALRERRPQLATVLGAPGLGKSRLLLALSERVDEEGAAHWGRCLPYGEGITYWPITEILKSAARIRHDDDYAGISAKLGSLLERLPASDDDELRTIAAAVSNLLGVSRTPRATYSAEDIGQAELHWGICRALQLLALERPLLLVFEDLHWAEPTLLELIRSLADVEEEAPILLVGSARPELKEAAPSILAPDGNRRVVDLVPLSEDESRALLAGLVGSAEAGKPFESLLRNAGGNPLFLEETVRMAGAANVDPEALPVPDNIQALIGSRLDALAPPEKRVAQQASVVGAIFWEGALAHLDGANGDGLTQRLGTLCRREFVQAHPETTIAGDREYEFRHILIRDVAYERLPKGRRAELHVRFTDWLEGMAGPDHEFVEIVAYHLEQACRLAGSLARSPIEPPVLAAAAALAAAAEKAQRREGWREAGRFYDRALALLGDAHAERSLELRYPRARVHAALGELDEAVDQLEAVAADALTLERPDLRCVALTTLGNIDHWQARAADARSGLTQALGLAVQVADRSLQVRATYGLAGVSADYEGEVEAAVGELRDAVSVAQDLDDVPLRIEGHLRLGFLLFNMGDIAGSEGEFECCIALAGQLGSVHDEARATFMLGLVKHYLGEPEEAERLGLQASAWLERTGDPYMQMQNFRALGLYAFERGDLEEAEQRLRAAIPIAVEKGGRPMLEVYRFLVETLVRRGSIDDAATLAEFAGRNVPEEDLVSQAYVLLARAAVGAARDDREALEQYAEAIDVLEHQKLPVEAADARMTFAAVLRRFDEDDEAREQLTLARVVFERVGARGSRGQADRELAEVASGAGRAGPTR